MDPKKITASALAFAALLTSFGCSAKKEDTESSSEPVIINTGIDPQSVVFDWQPLYEQKLADYKKSDAYSINSRFDIRDINSDGIPELILSPNDDPMTVCEIYTYTDGLEKVTDMGAYGVFRLIPQLGCVGYEYVGEGFTYGEYGQLREKVFQKDVTYYNNAASAAGGAVIKYEINSEDISLVEYEDKLKPYREGASITVGRKYTFGKDAIDYAIHCSESWGAVLSDIQKKSYSTLLSDILKKSPENDAAFELCDLDGNNLPELILSTGVAEDSDCKIYYLSDAAVSDLGNGCGRNGFISFDLKSKTFFSDNNGDIQCWSMTSSDLSKFSKSESCMDCGRKYLLTADGIESAFL